MSNTPIPTGTDPGPIPVTLIVPCLNEERFIENCLLSLLSGDYPTDLIEILVLDGQSTDCTRAILGRICQEFHQVRVIDNPGGSKPQALNTGIAEAKHSIVMRIDAHAIYPSNYISELVRCLHVYEADNVGGVRLNRTLGKGAVALALAAILTHPFGVGDAKHYTGSAEPIQSDILFLFCAHKNLFAEVGNFDERLIRGQDREFNLRMTRLGKKMVLCPSVTCTYYTREKISEFARWSYQSGRAPYDISAIMDECLISWRNLVPLSFVTALSIGPVLSIFIPSAFTLTILVLSTYMTAAIVATLGIRSEFPSWRARILMPFAFLLWHSAYGIGSLVGLSRWLKIERGS